jgi:hypothetical protein
VKKRRVSRYVNFALTILLATLLSLIIPNNAFANNLITANSTTTSNGITLYTKWSGDLLLTGCETLTLRPYANDFQSGVLQIIENGSVTQTFSLNNNNVNSVSGIFFNLCSNRSTFENGRISALGQNRNLNIRVSMTTMGRVYSSRYRTTINEIPVSRTLNTSFVYVVKAPQQTSNPAPQQTSNPAPQQTSNPAPQQTSNPTPQQTSNPTPQQTTNPTPQPTSAIDSYTPPMPDFSNYYRENKEIEDRVRQELIEEIKVTKQFTCRKYSRWNNFSNIAPPTFVQDGEMCMDYNAITSEETRVANVYPRYTIKNLIEVGSVPSAGLEGSKVSVYAIESKKKSKLIFQGKLKKESRSTLWCQIEPPTDYWGIQGCKSIYEGAYLDVKIPKKMGTFPNLKQRLKIVIENKNSIDKKKTWYISKEGMVE